MAHLPPEHLVESILEKERRIADCRQHQTPASAIQMNEIIFVVEEAAEGGFGARALDHSIFTEADSMETLRARIRDAVKCHFEEGQAPKMIRLHFVRDEVIAA